MSPIRLTGMATGLDVDTLVKQMMTAEKTKVDKFSQDRQVVLWRQDLYRELIGELNTFKSTYFDVLKPDNYMLSSRNYSSFDIISTLASTSTATTAVTATATAGAVAGVYKVNVENLAAKSSVLGTEINLKEAGNAVTFPTTIVSGVNNKLELTIDGGDKYTIDIDAKTYVSLSELASNINSKLTSTTAGSGKLSEKVKAVVSSDGKTIELASVIKIDDNNKKLNISIAKDDDTIKQYFITLGAGNYTLGELEKQITEALQTAKSSTDNTTEDISSLISVSSSSKTNITFGTKAGAITISTNHDTDYSVKSLSATNVNTGDSLANNLLEYGFKTVTGINNILNVSFGGSVYQVDIGDFDYTNSPDAVGDLKTLIHNKLLTQKDKDGVNLSETLDVETSLDGKRLRFISKTNEQISISGNAISTLGFSSSLSATVDVNMSANDKMSSLITASNSYNGKVSFNINGKDFNFDFSSTGADKNKTIGDVFNQISTQANVNISYSQLTRKFTMTSKETGALQSITAFDKCILDETNNSHSTGFLNALLGRSSVNTGDSVLPAKYDFTLSGDNFTVGKTITIEGKEYTAKAAGDTLGAQDFVIGKDIKESAANLAAKISGVFTAVSDSAGKITLTQKDATPITDAPVVAQTGTVTITAPVLSSPYVAVTAPIDNVIVKGKDAKVTITEPNGIAVTIERAKNNFTLDGVNYTLNDKIGEVNITLTSNPTKTFDKIKTFVDKYNEIIDKVNTKLFEKKQYDYKPLTDDQKKDMSEDDIKKWEEKAKGGLLSNDSMLSNMLYSMRNAFFEPVKDVSGSSIGISLSEIGITSSNDYSQRGKLVIDESKLKDALQNNGDKVAELFTRTSTSFTSYSPNLTTDQRKKRTSEEGIFQRLSDILQDNLRTLRDNNGKKGLLLEKAGIKGDLSEFKNLLTEDIERRGKIIKEMTTKLAEKENRYYLQFSKLETAMQKLNDQSNWLTQQLSSGS